METNGRMTLNYGIELSESCREVTWNPMSLNGHFKKDNNVQIKHLLNLKRAVIDPNSKEGELNCIEVVAKDDVLFEETKRPLTYLKFGTIFENNINMTYSTPPVKFILSQGNGPVYIHSEQIIDPQYQFDDDDEIDEEVLKRVAKRPFSRMDPQNIVSKRMRLDQNDEDEDVQDEEEDDDDEDDNAGNNLDLEEEQEDQSGDEEQESQSDDGEEVDVVEEVDEEEVDDEEEEQEENENDENEEEEEEEHIDVFSKGASLVEEEPQRQITPNIGYVTATDGDVDAESDSENEQVQNIQLNVSELNEYSEDEQEEAEDEN